MIIYLFCNQRYGMPFVETAARFASERQARIRVVLSVGRRRSIARRLPRLLGTHASRWLSAHRKGRRWGLPVTIMSDVNSARFRASLGADDCGVIAGFNQVFEPATVQCFRSLVNFHPSLLPLYAGAVPSHRCLANGENTTGFTLHKVAETIEEGHYLHQHPVPIQPGDDERQLDHRIAEAATPVLWRWLKHCQNDAPWNPLRLQAEAIYRAHDQCETVPPAA